VREIAQQRADRAAELRLLEGVDACCASVQGALEEPSFEMQHKVVQLVVDRIVVEDERVVIEHVVPTGPVRLQPEHHAPGTPLRAFLGHRRHVLTWTQDRLKGRTAEDRTNAGEFLLLGLASATLMSSIFQSPAR
jgi:hypothetical protein